MEAGGIVKGFQRPKSRAVGVRKYQYCKKLETRDDRAIYASPITFYDQIPDSTLSLNDFEKYALARLKVLRIIERTNTTSAIKYTADWENEIKKAIQKQGLTEFETILSSISDGDPDTLMQCRKFDHISHFLLRLAFSRTEEQRKWLIALEIDFFRLKACSAGSDALKVFLTDHKFPGVQISTEERNSLQKELLSAAGGGNHTQAINDVYKLPFIFAIDLVRGRRIFLKNGMAYVPYSELMSVVCASFRSYLSESLSLVKKNMYIIEQDQRIVQIVADFDRRHTGSDYVTKKSSSAISASDLPTLSQKSFPLCMKSLYDVVVKDHHLKHWGRLQLGLFLKAIGLPLEDATMFWRSHFTKKPEIDGSRFDKQYLYNIRHMYGQEGKRADYTPYSCMKIITSNVGPGDFHGCPFKHSDPAHLRNKLGAEQIPKEGVKEIMDLVEGHHYQIACQKYFEWTHDSMTVDGGVNHPNQYFEESRDVLSGTKTLKAQERSKNTGILYYPDGSSKVKSEVHSQSQARPSAEETMDVDIDDDEFDALMTQHGY